MDKATKLINEAVRFDAMAFGREIARQQKESEQDAESLPSLMGRRAARARAHTLAQMAQMTTASKLAGNMGTMIIALNIACNLLDVPRHERTAAALDWEASL